MRKVRPFCPRARWPPFRVPRRDAPPWTNVWSWSEILRGLGWFGEPFVPDYRTKVGRKWARFLDKQAGRLDRREAPTVSHLIWDRIELF